MYRHHHKPQLCFAPQHLTGVSQTNFEAVKALALDTSRPQQRLPTSPSQEAHLAAQVSPPPIPSTPPHPLFGNHASSVVGQCSASPKQGSEGSFDNRLLRLCQSLCMYVTSLLGSRIRVSARQSLCPTRNYAHHELACKIICIITTIITIVNLLFLLPYCKPPEGTHPPVASGLPLTY